MKNIFKKPKNFVVYLKALLFSNVDITDIRLLENFLRHNQNRPCAFKADIANC